MKTVIGATLILLTLNSCNMDQNKTMNMKQDKTMNMEQDKTMNMEQDKTMIEVFKSKKDIVINISAEKLWKIIGPGFAEYGKWATIVDHAIGRGEGIFVGAPFEERVCKVNGQGSNEVTEKLLQYSDTDMNLAYEATQGMPEMMDNARNEMTVVHESNNKSKIIVNMKWGVRGPLDEQMSKMMEENMSTLMDVFLNDIKVFAETGKVSESKQKRLDELHKM